MMTLLQWVVTTIPSILKTRQKLILKNLALRQQLKVLTRSPRRPQLTPSDRMFWIGWLRFWSHWSVPPLIVQPETVVRWHRQGFRLYWAWKSRGQRLGRPSIGPAVKDLLRTMSQAHPLLGAPRIHEELLKMDIQVLQATASYHDSTFLDQRYKLKSGSQTATDSLRRSINPVDKTSSRMGRVILEGCRDKDGEAVPRRFAQ